MNYSLHITRLSEGQETSFRPKGNSMSGRIESGNLVTISPLISDLSKGDIVFCRVKGNYYIHLISACRDEQYQISNNRGRINGWIGSASIYGKVIKVEP